MSNLKEKLIPLQSEEQLTEGVNAVAVPDVLFCANLLGALSNQGLRGEMHMKNMTRIAFDNQGKPMMDANNKPMTITEKVNTLCCSITVDIPLPDLQRYMVYLVVPEDTPEPTAENPNQFTIPAKVTSGKEPEIPFEEVVEEPTPEAEIPLTNEA
jgi:hypothetical protein